MEFKQFIENQNEKEVRINALKEWAEKLGENSKIRLHMSNNQKINIQSKGQYIAPDYSRMNGKPFGFWYALGSSWIDFTITEFNNAIGNYIFEVTINPSKIAFITNENQVRDIESRYQDANKSLAWGNFKNNNTFKYSSHKIDNSYDVHERPFMPNWQLMAKDYWGIEIDPEKVYEAWTQDWAVPSGCIWNKRGIANIKLIAKFDIESGSYIDV